MSTTPAVHSDSGDDFRRFFEPVPSLPEELARMDTPTLSIAQGCPDATAWDEDDTRIILPARTLAYVRDKIAGRYLFSPEHAQAVALIAIYQSRNANEFPDDLTETELARVRAAARQAYREQRVEYLLDWSPTIPDSERAA